MRLVSYRSRKAMTDFFTKKQLSEVQKKLKGFMKDRIDFAEVSSIRDLRRASDAPVSRSLKGPMEGLSAVL